MDITTFKTKGLRFFALFLLILAPAPSWAQETVSQEPVTISQEPNQKKSQNDLDEKKDAPIDFEVPPEPKLRLGPYLEFGGRTELGYNVQRNLDLDRAEADALDTMNPSLQITTKFTPHKKVRFILSMDLSRDIALKEKGEKEKRRFHLEITRAYVTFRKLIKGLTINVGRHKVKADRNWGFNDNIDGVSLSYAYKKLVFESALSWEGMVDKDLINDEDDKRVNNYIFRMKYSPNKKFKIAPYVTYRHDYTPDDYERPLFFGVHSSGEIIKRVRWWTEMGYAHGTTRTTDSTDPERTRFTFNGFGFDVGSTYESDLPLKPAVTLSYAFGSGDHNPDDGVDRGFRQSGLQSNSYKVAGLTSPNYYGEIFGPELSNMHIFTTGASIKPFKRMSCEFLYHYYFQHHASTEIRGSGLDAEPTGDSKGLGSELDFIIGIMDIYNFDLTSTVGIFLPGKAFSNDTNTTAFTARLKVKYNF
jgi:alginate production protein